MSIERETGAGLVEVLDRVLDKGIVIDAHVKVAVVGVELLAVEARVVVASIQTYLTHADALAFTQMAARPLAPEPGGPAIAEVRLDDALPPAATAGDHAPEVELPPAGDVRPGAVDGGDEPPLPS